MTTATMETPGDKPQRKYRGKRPIAEQLRAAEERAIRLRKTMESRAKKAAEKEERRQKVLAGEIDVKGASVLGKMWILLHDARARVERLEKEWGVSKP